MKKALSIFLTLTLAFSTLGYYPVFLVMQYQAREEVKQMLARNCRPEDLLRMELTQADRNRLEWEEDGREFRFQGRMYDVAFTRTEHGCTVYYCLEDSTETELFTGLDLQVRSYLNTEGTAQNKAAKNLLKVFSAVYLLPPAQPTIHSPSRILSGGFAYSELHSSAFKPVISPPPRRVV